MPRVNARACTAQTLGRGRAMAELRGPWTALLLLAFASGAVSQTRNALVGSGKLSTPVKGSGATTASDVLGSFASTINKKYGTSIRYNGKGSGAGRSEFIGSATLFCGSDVPMSVAEEARMAGYVKFTLPLAINTITAFTSVRGAAGIRLDAPTLAKIYMGKVILWNDYAIKAINPGLSLPAARITVVARKDSSGSTVLFTQWLSAFAKKQFPLAPGGQVKWPLHVVQVALTEGVLKYVKKHPNAITYSGTGSGTREGITEVALKNRAGNYILASQSDPTLSVPRTLPPATASWASVNLIGKTGGKSWPITSFLYILARRNQVQVGVPGGVLKAWLTYIMSSKVQPLLSNFQLSVCPPSVLKKNRAAIATMQLTPGIAVPNFN